MAHFPIGHDTLDRVIRQQGIVDLGSATIRQICSLSAALEDVSGEKFIHLELGNPGIPSNPIGVHAQCDALSNGVSNRYPVIQGIPELKDAGARFVKSFINLDIPSKCIIPTVGSMQGSFTMMELLNQRQPGRNKMLFINPGFPAQRCQAKVIGMGIEKFDIYDFRDDKLEAKLEEILSKGDVTGMIYSNPNNPAWFNLTQKELEIIGRMATKYDTIVLEDHAYMGMDFRTYYGEPGKAPFIPTVARYTDNYILLLSASKIFSYAGERIAIMCMSPIVAERQYPYLQQFYEMPTFLDAYVFGILYCASSGTSHSAQYAMAAMLEAACNGEINFVHDTSEYGRRAARAKAAFNDAGFNIVYSHDGDQEISDGFFFTTTYPGFDSIELQKELLRYGICGLPLPSTGSEQQGLRICVSLLKTASDFEQLKNRLDAFKRDH